MSSHVKISTISLISSLSLKLYLNSLVYHRNIFGSSSKVFRNLWTSSEIFGNSPKMFSNVCQAFRTILENLRKSSENHQKCHHHYVYMIKRTFAALTCQILFLPLEHKIHIFSPPCNILYLLILDASFQMQLKLS